jgi:hypothetical protein
VVMVDNTEIIPKGIGCDGVGRIHLDVVQSQTFIYTVNKLQPEVSLPTGSLLSGGLWSMQIFIRRRLCMNISVAWCKNNQYHPLVN